MSNRVLLITGNFHPEPTGIGKYSGEMINWLAENGYSCTVITTFPYYPDWKVQSDYSKSRFWFKKEIKSASESGRELVTIIRCPHYIPTSPTGAKRLLSEFTISFSSYLALIALLFAKRFDYILTIAPPFELGLLGSLYKKIRGGLFAYHLQDLQIDAARELQMIKSPTALSVLTRVERYIINTADVISTISEGMIKKVRKKTNKDIVFFPNWVNTNFFYPLDNKSQLKEKFGFKATDKVVLYSGAIGVKQGLESMIHSAKSFSELENVIFVICGCGPYLTHLQKLKNDLNADNVRFLPLQEPERFNEFLNLADIHLVIQKSDASDLMMPSKLSTILAVGGVPIVTAKSGSGLHDLVDSYNLGIVVEPDNQQALNLAIRSSIHMDFKEKRSNARNYAQEHLSVNKVMPAFMNRLVSVKKRMEAETAGDHIVLSRMPE